MESAVQEFSISYADVEATLKPIGGTSSLLMMLPAIAAGVDETVLAAIEAAIDRAEPVIVSLEVPRSGLKYVVKLGGKS